MEELIRKYKKQLADYRNMIQDYESKGLENLSFEDTEYYGAYLGNV